MSDGLISLFVIMKGGGSGGNRVQDLTEHRYKTLIRRKCDDLAFTPTLYTQEDHELILPVMMDQYLNASDMEAHTGVGSKIERRESINKTEVVDSKKSLKTTEDSAKSGVISTTKADVIENCLKVRRKRGWTWIDTAFLPDGDYVTAATLNSPHTTTSTVNSPSKTGKKTVSLIDAAQSNRSIHDMKNKSGRKRNVPENSPDRPASTDLTLMDYNFTDWNDNDDEGIEAVPVPSYRLRNQCPFEVRRFKLAVAGRLKQREVSCPFGM
jgi:hypothetical protein